MVRHVLLNNKSHTKGNNMKLKKEYRIPWYYPANILKSDGSIELLCFSAEFCRLGQEEGVDGNNEYINIYTGGPEGGVRGLIWYRWTDIRPTLHLAGKANLKPYIKKAGLSHMLLEHYITRDRKVYISEELLALTLNWCSLHFATPYLGMRASYVGECIDRVNRKHRPGLVWDSIYVKKLVELDGGICGKFKPHKEARV